MSRAPLLNRYRNKRLSQLMESAPEKVGANKNADGEKKKSAIVSYDLLEEVCEAIHTTASAVWYLTKTPFRLHLVLECSSLNFSKLVWLLLCTSTHHLCLHVSNSPWTFQIHVFILLYMNSTLKIRLLKVIHISCYLCAAQLISLWPWEANLPSWPQQMTVLKAASWFLQIFCQIINEQE